MSENLQGVLRMPPDIFWSDDPIHRVQVDSIRVEAADRIIELEQHNAELSELLAHAVSVADAIDTGEPPPDDDDFVRWLKNSKALLARTQSAEVERDESN